MEVPVQFFQSVIAIELGVAGALLFEIRFFDAPDSTGRAETRRTDPRVLLFFSVVLGATLFGSLWAIVHHAGTTAASAVTVGVAVSLLPIVLRVLPPLVRNSRTKERDADYAYTVLALVMYVALVAGVTVLLNT